MVKEEKSCEKHCINYGITICHLISDPSWCKDYKPKSCENCKSFIENDKYCPESLEIRMECRDHNFELWKRENTGIDF